MRHELKGALALFATSLLLLFVAACGDDDAGNYTTVEEVRKDRVNVETQLLEACGGPENVRLMTQIPSTQSVNGFETYTFLCAGGTYERVVIDD